MIKATRLHSTYVQKCMQWRNWRNWRKIASCWRFELDAKSGPLEAGDFGENGDFGEIGDFLHSIRVAYELLKFILTRFIEFLLFCFCFLFLTGKQDDDDVPGRSSTRVCKPPGGGSSLSLS